MMFNLIHHVAIIVSDYEKSKKFYVEQLELPIIRENYRKERNDYKLDLKVGNIELEIFGVEKPPARVTQPEACGLRHLAFKVDDIEEAVKWLNSKGIQTEPIRMDEYTQKRMTFFRDPDNLPLEIHE
ncbi:MAG: VOC family protein [Agathobacter sp.]|nr:VOC family protein [Agathobacter sp.]